MSYFVPPHGQLRAGYMRTNRKKLWDGVSPLGPNVWAFYRTPDYAMPAFHSPSSAAAVQTNFTVVPESELDRVHEGYVKLRDTLTQIGLLGGEATDDEAITFSQDNGMYGRLMRLGSPHNETPIMNYHLLTGSVENYSKLFGRKSDEAQESTLTVDAFLTAITRTFMQGKDTLIQNGVEPTPSNLRKLFLFQAANKLFGKDWVTLAPNFTESVMRFIRLGAPLSTLMAFHRARGVPDTLIGNLEANPVSRRKQFKLSAAHSAVCVPMSDYEVQNLTQLPQDLMRELYFEGCMLYNGSEEKYRAFIEEMVDSL